MDSEWLTYRQAQLATEGWDAQHVAQLAAEQAKTEKAIEAFFGAGAAAPSDGGPARHQAVVAAASTERLMKPVNLAAQLAAAETELACLKIALGQVKEDREELRQEQDAWRREATKLYAEKLIQADEGRFAPRSAAHGGDAAHLSHWPDDAVQRPRDAADRRGRFKRFMHQG